MTRFIGVDPGLASGLVSFHVDERNSIANFEHYQVDHIGLGNYFEELKSMWKTKRPEDWDTVIAMESYIVTPGTAKKSQAPWSLESIGMVRYFVETSGLSLRMSAPSAHKKLVSDAVLKSAGLFVPGQGHSNDAARVALHVAIVDYKLLREHLKTGEEDG